MGRRPLLDFVDIRLNGELNLKDFESILRVAVLCVAGSSRGRPTTKEVYDEMNKAWKNTFTNMVRTSATLWPEYGLDLWSCESKNTDFGVIVWAQPAVASNETHQSMAIQSSMPQSLSMELMEV